MAQWIWVWLFLKVEGDLEFFFTMIQPFSSFARRLRTSWHYYTRQLQYMGKIRFWCFVFYTPLSSLQSTGMFIPSNCVTAMQQKNPVNGSTSYLRILCSRKYLLGILCTAFTNQKWNIQKQFRRNKLDRVPVSVSEWLFGSFVLILFGDYVYFSWFNSHISKEWDGNAV